MCIRDRLVAGRGRGRGPAVGAVVCYSSGHGLPVVCTAPNLVDVDLPKN